MKNAILVYLIKRNEENKIYEILLSMKKRGFGVGKWHGVGGPVNETIISEDSVKDVFKDKVNIDLADSYKVAELHYEFPHEPDWNQFVHVYFSQNFSGVPQESEEFLPMWFTLHNLPFDEMIDGDEHILPHLIGDKSVSARLTFGKGEVLEDLKIDFVDKF